MNQFKEIAIQAAQEGGEILKDYFGNIKKIVEKKDAGLVTEADQASEKRILAILKKNFPDHNLIGEETGAVKKGSSEFNWLIDPLDGTTNYAHGFPFFCISIALEYKKEIILGVILEPLTGNLYLAQKGQGAFLNGKKLEVSRIANLHNALLSTGFAYQKGEMIKYEVYYLEKMLRQSRGVRRTGAAALDICYVAQGMFDGFWEKHLEPWDTAAASLILTEAGGKISTFSGKTYSPYHKEVLATNSLVHQSMIKILTKK